VTVYTDTVYARYRVEDFAGGLVEEFGGAPTPTLAAALDDIEAALARRHGPPICGVMVAVAAPVDSVQGRVLRSRRWGGHDFALVPELRRRLGGDSAPLILVDNNARLAAWGERTAGVCQGLDHFVTLILHGSGNPSGVRHLGLGSGLVLDGRLFRGFQGMAGELDASFYNWFRVQASDARTAVKCLGDMGPELIEDFGRHMGTTFAHLVNYLSPQRVALVFDHEPVSELFCAAFERAMDAHRLPEAETRCPIVVSELGERATLIGGNALLRERYFKASPQLLQRLDSALAE